MYDILLNGVFESMKVIKRFLLVGIVFACMLSFFIISASAYSEQQQTYNITLPSYPVHSPTSGEQFINGCFIDSNYNIYYFEYYMNNTNYIPNKVIPCLQAVQVGSSVCLMPCFYYVGGISSYVALYGAYFKVYDSNGTLVKSVDDNGIAFDSYVRGLSSKNICIAMNTGYFNKSIYNDQIALISSGVDSSKNFLSSGICYSASSSYSNYTIDYSAIVFNSLVYINGDLVIGSITYHNQGTANAVPVYDSNGNLLYYNYDIDIDNTDTINAINDLDDKLTNSDEEVDDGKLVNNSDLEDFEDNFKGEDITIPSFDSSLVSGSSTFWSFCESILNAFGLKNYFILAMCIGLVTFILGRKVNK